MGLILGRSSAAEEKTQALIYFAALLRLDRPGTLQFARRFDAMLRPGHRRRSALQGDEKENFARPAVESGETVQALLSGCPAARVVAGLFLGRYGSWISWHQD